MFQQVWLAVGGSVSGPKWRIAILSNELSYALLFDKGVFLC